MTRLTKKVNMQQPSNLHYQATPLATQPPEVTVTREFKINAQTGERGQKDKLPYSNLSMRLTWGKKNTVRQKLLKQWQGP